MTRIDAHQHFWKLSRNDYGWLNRQDFPSLYRDFLPEHLAPLLNRSGIDRSVVVQAAPTDAETQFLLSIAQQSPFVAGVVGWVDFEAADAADRIETLSHHPGLLGLRPMIQDLPDDEWMLRPTVTRAVDAMTGAGLRLDALVKPRHLPVLLRFLERHPDLAVVIDHGGEPSIASGAIDDWADQIGAIARNTSAFCKLSGLATEAGPGWSAATLRPFVDALVDAFGPRRLMWGSDWPVLHAAFPANGSDTAPYSVWLETAHGLLGGLTANEHDRIFGNTAAEFYGVV